MIADTFSGAVLVSIVNIAVVFAVLTFLAIVIKVTYKAVTRSQKEPAVEIQLPESHGQQFVDTSERVTKSLEVEEACGKTPVPLECLDASLKAAITAVLSLYLDMPKRRVFVRKITDAGAWGKSSRARFKSPTWYGRQVKTG